MGAAIASGNDDKDGVVAAVAMAGGVVVAAAMAWGFGCRDSDGRRLFGSKLDTMIELCKRTQRSRRKLDGDKLDKN